jgi:hypothetical protein
MARTASSFFALAVSLVVVSAAQGCAVKGETDEADRFRQAIPGTKDVALDVPKSSDGAAASTKSLSTKGDLPAATDARYYRFTRDVADGVDWATGVTLGLVWVIVHSPPTHLEPHKAVWGPGNGNALDPVVWRMTVVEIGDDEYDYRLEGRPKASTNEGDFRAILTGHGFGEHHAKHKLGGFTIDNDAYRALDPLRGKDEGTVKIDFDLRAYPATIGASVHTTADAKGFFDVTVTHERDAGGAVDIMSRGDIEEVAKDGKLEDVVLHSRWNATGAGRADVTASGGSLTTTVTATECWSS